MPAEQKTTVRKEDGSFEAPRSSRAEVNGFLKRLQSIGPVRSISGRGRLIFAMDATMSRQPTWDLALGLQADMFRAVKEVGGLDVQLVYFRKKEGQRSRLCGRARRLRLTRGGNRQLVS